MNDGFINEEELRKEINSKRFDGYNPNIKSFLSFAFGSELNPLLPFKAEQIAGQSKPDMRIIHNGIKKHISVKKGTGNSVHQESIDLFFPFIEDVFGPAVLDNLKFFHYGDGTTNDTGKIRYNANECKKRYVKEISAVNKAFNEWSELSRFLDRFLFIGNVGSDVVDIVYHGTISSALWASREEIIDYVKNSKDTHDAVHFGPLTYQVWGRNDKWTAVHPERRYIMQVKWGSLAKDLRCIRERND